MNIDAENDYPSEVRLPAGRPVGRPWRPLWKEGDDGLFSQTWYPLMPSGDLGVGDVKGLDFLDGRVAVFRGENGKVRVFSGICPHLGADLGAGEVCGNELRCAFHFWYFNQDGVCVKTGTGDPPPPTARLFEYPSVEKWGVIFAFNGDKPLWELPDDILPYPEEDLYRLVHIHTPPFPVDPWVLSANTPDWSHLKAVHEIEFDDAGLFEKVDWTDHSMHYFLDATLENGKGARLAYHRGLYGTNIFYMHGMLDGEWIGVINPFAMPRPQLTYIYYICLVKKSDGGPEDKARAERSLQKLCDIATEMVEQDRDIMDENVRYAPGLLTRSDRALGRLLQMFETYPRAHPGGPYIR